MLLFNLFMAGLRRLLALTGIALVAMPALAEVDLTLMQSDTDEDTYLRLDANVQTAQLVQDNPWGDNDAVFLGGETEYWADYGFTPGIEGQFRFGESGMSLNARLSAVWTKTRGLDSAGSNAGDTSASDFTMEDAYLKWTSGNLFSSLGHDALEISGGAQKYQVGNGFIFYDGGSDGGARGGFWLGARNAFDRTAIVRLTTGNWMIEGVYLNPNDNPDSGTDVAGTNVEYSFGETGTVGVGYWNILDSDNERRDGLSVFDIRAQLTPFEGDRAFGIGGELVVEKNGSKNDSWGANIEAGYDFSMDSDSSWLPAASYRYASFTGDDGTGDNGAFDPLFYGFNDWNEWYVGEIVGEYIASNSNLNMHTVKLAVTPTETVTAYLFWHYFRLNEFQDELVPRPPASPVGAGAIQNKDLGHEFNLIVDWSPTEHLAFSATANILIPAEGGRDFFGSSDNWTVFMLWAKLSY